MSEKASSPYGSSEDNGQGARTGKKLESSEPPGRILLCGFYFSEHREEIMALAQEVERREREIHPHDKILSIQNTGRSTIITTSGTNLPRRIASALFYAFKGQVTFKYDRDLDRVRMTWSR